MRRNEDTNEVTHHDALKDHYSRICTEIYNEIEAHGTNHAPGGNWSVKEDNETGITTWTLKEDRKLGRTGTKNELEVKIFSPQAYDFVKTEDFIDRAKLICNAARELAEKYGKDNPTLQEQIKEFIQKIEQDFAEGVQDEKRKIQPDIMREAGMSYFIPRYKVAKSELKQLAANAASCLIALAANNNVEISQEKMISELEQQEKQIIKKRGRPAIMKFGMIGAQGNEVQMMSAQFPIGPETLPSSLRDGIHNKKVANHVLDVTATVSKVKEGNDVKHAVNVKTVVDGHSSYTPIAENDRLLRLKGGYDAFKEKVEELARLQRKINPEFGSTRENPLKVTLSTLVLLTPLALMNIEGKVGMKNESETAQVEEGNIAMNLLASAKQPLALKDESGKTFYVTLDHTSINMPSNKFATANRIKEAGIQKQINAKGMTEYMLNMRKAITDPNKLKEFLTLFADDQSASDAVAKLMKFMPRMMKPKSEKLDEAYQQLERLLETYQRQVALPKDKMPERLLPDLRAMIAAKEEEIKSIESQHYESYQNNMKGYKSAFNKNKTDQAELIQLMQTFIQRDVSPEMKEYALMINRYLTAQDMYFNKKYLDFNYTFQFQALYLLSNEQAGRDIEAFCKSGEDRTGWMRVTLLALTAYRETHQRDPDFNNPNDVRDYHQNYVVAAHELSASLDCTGFNSDARGMQVSADCTTRYKPIECDRLMAVLAKGVYEDKSITPSYTISLVAGQLQTTKKLEEKRFSFASLTSSSDSVQSRRGSKVDSRRDSLAVESRERKGSGLGDSLVSFFAGKRRDSVAPVKTRAQSGTQTKVEEPNTHSPSLRRTKNE